MSDRTNVNIVIKKSDYNEILKEKEQTLMNKDYCSFEDTFDIDEINTQDKVATFIGYEINYGDWEQLENYLQDKKIEYDKYWGSGDEYCAGEGYFRVIEGVRKYYELDEINKSLEKFVNELKKVVDNPKKLKDLVLKKHKEQNPFEIRPLDEANSINFIK